MESIYGSIRNDKISEIQVAHALYKIDAYLGNNVNIKLSDFNTNCNKILLDRLFGNDDTRDKVTCLPLDILIQLNKKFNFVKESMYVNLNPLDTKKLIFTAMVNSERKIDNQLKLADIKVGNFNLDWFFKPPQLSIPSDTLDFTQLTSDGLLQKVFSSGTTLKTTSKTTSKFKTSWLRMSELYRVTAPLCYKTSFIFIGFCTLTSDDVEELYQEIYHSEFFKTFLKALKNPKAKAISFYIHFDGHWKAAIFNKENNVLCVYASEGTRLYEWPASNSIYFYSYDTGTTTNKTDGDSQDQREVMDLIALFKLVSSVIPKSKMIINREQSQIKSGECGMFSLMFLYLMYIVHTSPKSINHLAKKSLLTKEDGVEINDLILPYKFFKFSGDKKMGLYRSLWFVENDLTLKIDKNKNLIDLIEIEKHGKSIIDDIKKKYEEDLKIF
ncbi:viral core cysteine proteinase [Carp edema virus]|nr:viral core cysteine proteinase [Carp edema virus]